MGYGLCIDAGPRSWWALPLLLTPPAATNAWDSLTLTACADLLEPLLREQARASGRPGTDTNPSPSPNRHPDPGASQWASGG